MNQSGEISSDSISRPRQRGFSTTRSRLVALRLVGRVWLSRESGVLEIPTEWGLRRVLIADGGLCVPEDALLFQEALLNDGLNFEARGHRASGDRALLARLLFEAARQLVDAGMDPLVGPHLKMRVDAESSGLLPLSRVTHRLLVCGDGDLKVPAGIDRASVLADLGALVLLGFAGDEESIPRTLPPKPLPPNPLPPNPLPPKPAVSSAPPQKTAPAPETQAEVPWVEIPEGEGGMLLAQTHLVSQAREEMGQRHWAEARRLLEAARDLGPYHAEAKVLLALVLLSAPRWDADLVEAQRIVHRAERKRAKGDWLVQNLLRQAQMLLQLPEIKAKLG